MIKMVLLVVFGLYSLPVVCATGPAATYAFDPRCPVDRPFIERGAPRLGVCSKNENMGKEECKIEAGCVSCNSLESLLMLGNAEDCSKCSNRMLDESGRYCRLKECPKEKPFYEISRGCKSCEDEPVFINKAECEQCPGRRWVEDAKYCAPDVPGRFYHKNGDVKIWQDGQVALTLPLTGGGAPWFTSCGHLSPSYGMAVSEQECARCPNTYMKDGFCFGKE